MPKKKVNSSAKKKILKNGGKNFHPTMRPKPWQKIKKPRQQRKLKRILERVLLRRTATEKAMREQVQNHEKPSTVGDPGRTVYHVLRGVSASDLTFEQLTLTKEDTDILMGENRYNLKNNPENSETNYGPVENRVICEVKNDKLVEQCEERKDEKLETCANGDCDHDHKLPKASPFRIPQRKQFQWETDYYRATNQPSTSHVDDDCLSITAPDIADFFGLFPSPKPHNISSEASTITSYGRRQTKKHNTAVNEQDGPPTSSHLNEAMDTSEPCYKSPLKNLPTKSDFPTRTKSLDERKLCEFNALCNRGKWNDAWKFYSACKSELVKATKIDMISKLMREFLKMKSQQCVNLLHDLRHACPDWVELRNDALIYDMLHAFVGLKFRKNILDYFCNGSVSPREDELRKCLWQFRKCHDLQSFWMLLTLYVKWKLPLCAPLFAFALKCLADGINNLNILVDVFSNMLSEDIGNIYQGNVHRFVEYVDSHCDFDIRINVCARLEEHGFSGTVTNHFWDRLASDDSIDENYLNSLANFILTNTKLAGETYYKLIMYIKKNLNNVFPAAVKRYLTQIGVLVLLECHESRNISQAYKVLQVLHAEQMHYLELQDVTAHGVRELISAKFIALVAVDVALKMNSTISACVIFQGIEWARSCCNDSSHWGEGKQRLQLLELLFYKLFDEGKLFYLKLVFNELILSYADDFALLGDIYTEVLDLKFLYNITVGKFVRRRDAENALCFVSRGKIIPLTLREEVHRSLVLLLRQMNWTKQFREQYELGQQMKIYPTLKVEDICKIFLRTHYTTEEIQIILEYYLSAVNDSDHDNLCIDIEQSLPAKDSELLSAFIGVAVDAESFHHRFTAALESLPHLRRVTNVEDDKIYITVVGII